MLCLCRKCKDELPNNPCTTVIVQELSNLMLDKSSSDDQESIMIEMVQAALVSRTARQKLLSVRGQQAIVFMHWIQRMLDEASEYSRAARSDYRYTLRHLLVRLSRQAEILPPSLFVHSVTCQCRDAVAGGGFSDIFKASLDDSNVALKRLRVFQTSEKDRQEFYTALCKEALVWRQLKHRHILPFLGVDCDTFRHRVCLISPWMQNGNIIQCINRLESERDHIPLARWLEEISSGLEYLHREKIVHGDLRGANILINDDMTVALADFGLAMFADTSTESWGSHAGGAVRWLAPEVLKGSRPTLSSDVYAFGCVCLEIDTGHPPFYGITNDAQVVARVLQGARPQKPDSAGRLRSSIWHLVTFCWKEDPSDRPDAAFITKYLSNRASGVSAGYDLVFKPLQNDSSMAKETSEGGQKNSPLSRQSLLIGRSILPPHFPSPDVPLKHSQSSSKESAISFGSPYVMLSGSLNGGSVDADTGIDSPNVLAFSPFDIVLSSSHINNSPLSI